MMHNILNKYELDTIPRYLFQRDILGMNMQDEQSRKDLLSSKSVKKITDQQLEDGSWDRFHTLSSDSVPKISTENAIRRLLILGLDMHDEPIRKAYLYMERYLKREIDFRDRKEKLSDWNEITDLFAAAWMLEIDPSSEIAGRVADQWAALIVQSFSGETFDYQQYSKAFMDIFNVKAGKRVWDIESFHIAAILKERIPLDIEEKYIRYILNNEKGLYYITGNKKLSELPETFMSRETSRFLFAHTVLSRYSSYKNICPYVEKWLQENQGEDGFWDLGSASRDNVFLPYSESWRKGLSRKVDSTLFIQKYLCSIGSR